MFESIKKAVDKLTQRFVDNGAKHRRARRYAERLVRGKHPLHAKHFGNFTPINWR